jgi:hypothetical protein
MCDARYHMIGSNVTGETALVLQYVWVIWLREPLGNVTGEVTLEFVSYVTLRILWAHENHETTEIAWLTSRLWKKALSHENHISEKRREHFGVEKKLVHVEAMYSYKAMWLATCLRLPCARLWYFTVRSCGSHMHWGNQSKFTCQTFLPLKRDIVFLVQFKHDCRELVKGRSSCCWQLLVQGWGSIGLCPFCFIVT